MSDTLTYQYDAPSMFQQQENGNSLFLSKFSEIENQTALVFSGAKCTIRIRWQDAAMLYVIET